MSKEEAAALVKKFLRLMEERDVAGAEKLMAPGARITFPGGHVHASQKEMVAASKDRYQWVKKSIEQVDCLAESDSQIVYVLGTLHGVNKHGIAFQDVRFVDRFEIQNGVICRQDVWNDLADSGGLEKSGP